MKKFTTLIVIISFFLVNRIKVCADEPIFSDVKLRIGLEYKYKNASQVNIINKNIIVGYAQNGEFISSGKLSSSTGFMAEIDSNNKVVLKDKTDKRIIFDSSNNSIQICDALGGSVNLGDRRFRGAIEFLKNKSGNITAVNVLSLNEYLYSVIPSEMPSTWNLEALKAQAVASRSYTATRKGVHKESGYDLCDSVHCQVYLGEGNEAVNTTIAVNETSRLMAYHNNAPINAVFFSSSGGATDNSENVWSNAVPYLRGVLEVNETTGKEWERRFTLTEINNLLAKKNYNIGNATKVSIGSLTSTGRVNELVINGTNGSKKLYGEEIRTFFSPSKGGALESKYFKINNGISKVVQSAAIPDIPITASFSNTNYINNDPVISGDGLVCTVLPSPEELQTIQVAPVVQKNQVIIENVVTESIPGNDIVFVGKGWGHGVGMSQHGANGMAEMGFKFEEILKHYYTGIEIR